MTNTDLKRLREIVRERHGSNRVDRPGIRVDTSVVRGASPAPVRRPAPPVVRREVVVRRVVRRPAPVRRGPGLSLGRHLVVGAAYLLIGVAVAWLAALVW